MADTHHDTDAPTAPTTTTGVDGGTDQIDTDTDTDDQPEPDPDDPLRFETTVRLRQHGGDVTTVTLDAAPTALQIESDGETKECPPERARAVVAGIEGYRDAGVLYGSDADHCIAWIEAWLDAADQDTDATLAAMMERGADEQ